MVAREIEHAGLMLAADEAAHSSENDNVPVLPRLPGAGSRFSPVRRLIR